MKLLGKKDPSEVNSIADLKKFLSTPDQPLTMEEFKEFWATCSEEERREFKKTELPQV